MTPVEMAARRSRASGRRATAEDRFPVERGPVGRGSGTVSSTRLSSRPNVLVHDWECVAAMRRGDDEVFAQVVDRYHGQLIRLAASYVRDRAVVEEVVQDTWMAVICGIDRFEGRSSFKTWLFRIMTNIAKKRGARERRSVPLSALGVPSDDEGAAPDIDCFLPDGRVWAGHWAASPASWGAQPIERLLANESRDVIENAIERLPALQRRVITLRDVEGWSPQDVCDVLGISDGNHRIVLHRARTKVRAALDAYFTSSRA